MAEYQGGPLWPGSPPPMNASPYDFYFVPPLDQTGASMQPYEPSLRERVGNWIYDAAQGYGLPANRMRNEAEMAIDFVPGIGDAVGFDEANRDVAAGHPVLGGIGYGAAALGMVPMVGDALSGGVKKGIRAYHGSPHDFDRFSLDKIGTGEGAQAYGHGLYFAENEGVARSYRDALSSDGYEVGGKRIASPGKNLGDPVSNAVWHLELSGGDAEKAKARVDQYANLGWEEYAGENGIALKSAIDEVQRVGWRRSPAGRMYEVNIDANPDDFLDWDKPLSEQRARELLDGIYPAGLRGGDVYQMMMHDGRNVAIAQGDSAATPLARARAQARVAARDLESLGIPGIKYRDEGSRANFYVSENIVRGGKQDGWRVDSGDERHWGKFKTEKEARDFVAQKDAERTHNYVVFDDKLINIVRKYGIAGALAAGLLTREQAQAMSEQGYI